MHQVFTVMVIYTREDCRRFLTVVTSQMGEEPHYKIVMLGDSGVGKTALVSRISEGGFADTHVPTVGAQFVALPFQVDKTKLTLEVWDTAGQEVYRSLVSFYTREARGAFLVFDVTDEKTFTGLEQWIKFANEQAPGAKIILFANKTDLEEKRVVSSADIKEFASKNSIDVVEGSAKTGQNTQDAFEKMGMLMVETEGNASPEVAIEKEEKPGKKKSCC